MTLPNATLFPAALLPLYIFEPRYRQMLAEVLATHRMFSVAMQRSSTTRESPSPIAGLGLIRVSVRHKDGTSHLILQGLARVELEQVTQYRPYRIQHIRPLESPPPNTVKVDALLSQLRGLLQQRIKLRLPFPGEEKSGLGTSPFSPKQILGYLDSIADPEQTADLVSCAVLSGAAERQAILETLDVELRLKRLISFLVTEMQSKRKRVEP